MNSFKHLYFSCVCAALVIFFAPGSLRGQGCDSPALLCAQQPAMQDSINAANPIAFQCFNALNTVFYSFTTNSNGITTGSATIDISSIQCNGVSNADFIEAMIVQPASGLDPCNLLNWTAITGCFSDTTSISIETGDLNPSTEYFVMIGSDQLPGLLNCGFEISIGGEAVTIDACCDQLIYLGDNAELMAVGGSSPPGYNWSPPSWLDDDFSDMPISYPEETITYTVEGLIPSENPGIVGGCTTTDQVTVVVGPPIDIPNTFTPNGDGINDTWQIEGIQNFTNSQITVYTRWGQKVYSSLGYANEWDGTNNGKELPTATYYYVIELNSLDVNIPEITGNVTLIH